MHSLPLRRDTSCSTRCHLQEALEPDHIQPLSRTFDLAMEGDCAAIEALFAPCIPRLRRVTARFLSNRQDSEDALQDGLLLAFRHLGQFEGRAQFSTWLHSIVVNAARTRLRRRQSGPTLCSIDESIGGRANLAISDILVDRQPSAESLCERSERLAALSKVVDALPPRWAVVVRLYDLEGLSMREVAARLGTTVSAAKTRHHRASRMLSKILKHRVATEHRQYPPLSP